MTALPSSLVRFSRRRRPAVAERPETVPPAEYDPLPHYWHALQGVIEWVRFADAKAAAILAVNGVLFAFFTGQLRAPRQPEAVIALAGCGMTLTSLSGLLALWAVIPRIRMVRPRSVLYFDHAAACQDADAYRAQALPVFTDPDELVKALTDQVWAFSRQSRRKYFFITRAVWCLIGAVVVALPTVLLA